MRPFLPPLLFLAIGLNSLLPAQNVAVTFKVNMSNETISPNGIHVAGNFQSEAGYPEDWNPGTTALSDEDNDEVYEITLTIPSGVYEYKFINGNAWGMDESPPAECTVGNNHNRLLILGDSDLDLPVVDFNACNPVSIDTNYETYWWNDAVFYEIFVRSFYDSDGDGIGDFQGIIQKLDYLNDGNPETDTDLGVTGIWLMPMMQSPSYHGYDISDYYTTEPDYGTMADFEELLNEAHARGIKVIIDFVMNHTSTQHPWFSQSANNQNDFRDWYIWSDTNPGWNGPWGQQVWHNSGGDYYYGLFWGGMPDLNYSHPPVKEELWNITNFWLDKGVDGFRLDAIKYLDEDGSTVENTPENFSLLEEFNMVYKTNNPDAFTVGEVWDNTSTIIPYVQNNRLDACFEFGLAGSVISSVNNGSPNSIQYQIDVLQQSYPRLQYATFLTNHDIDRVFSQLGSSTPKMKQAAALYLTMPGIPFIYYGEELGMRGTGAHENIRRPMQWSNETHAGFSTSTPWYGLGDNYLTNNVESMEDNPNSLLRHYKNLVHIRNDHLALQRGYLLDVESNNDNVLSYARIYEEEAVIVMSNFGGSLSNPSISLPVSSLPAGSYYVTDLYNNESMGSLVIDEKGGFPNWQASGTVLNNRETWILLLSLENPVSSSDFLEKNLNFTLAPNPATTEVEVKFEQPLFGNIEVFDSAGNALSLYHLTYGKSLIPTGHLPAGVYFIKLTVDEKVGIERLVVAK